MSNQQGLEYDHLREDEVQPLWSLLDQSLHLSMQAGWTDRVGVENFRVIRHNGRLVGGLGIMQMGQWFGGKNVPSAGVTAVGVSPEHRGKGTASFLLRQTLEEIHDRGLPISSLFPSTLTVYRRSGYDRAGAKIVYDLKTQAIDVRERSLEVVPVDSSGHEEIYHAYSVRARSTSGNLDRTPYMWDAILGAGSRSIFKYLFTNDGATEGYIVFQQARSASHIRVRDLCVLTPEAGRRLLQFLADHRSTIDSVSWNGSPADPLVHLLGEQEATATRSRDWVMRVIDVRGALEARGYPQGLDAELHLDVEDDLLPWNNGKYVLRVSDGNGEVTEGGQGHVRIGIRGLASLYTSHMTPQDLKATGQIDGEERHLAVAGLMFSGPRPWIPDQF